ncbi:MAG TPA: protein kinase [Pyrinomonadaceae bacterium]|nr:protein kinase [Pyrinomonadaceae bacterium]
MNPDNWPKVKEIFDQALARPAGERAAFVRDACGDDQELRQEVVSLLRSYEDAESFMETPAVQSAARSLAGDGKLSVGQQITHYVIRALIGEGGMGEVYLAEDIELHRQVAIKRLPAELATNQSRLRRFEQEARAISALNHPNIITIHEIAQADGLRFIVSEFIDGDTLRERMLAERLKLTTALDIATQVAGALAAAHAADIVHRDIKPENIMIRRDGLVKVLDFGVAKLNEPRTLDIGSELPTATRLKTEPGMLIGTPSYMSPEQARGDVIDQRTDLWAVGVVLYEMLAGHPPFSGQTSSHIIVSILEREPPLLVTLAEDVPTELQRIVRKTLAKDREQRYQTARDLLIDLNSLRRDLDLQSEIKRSRGTDASLFKTATGTENRAAQYASGSFSSATMESRAVANAEDQIYGKKRRQLYIGIAGAALIAIAIVTTAVLLSRRSPVARPPTQRALARLTFDAGLQSEPSWSPDGQFVAYSSNRSGNFDIWVKPLGEGDPVQVTKSSAHDWQPDWSVDGKRIVFRSERDGGGLFVVPAPTGGNERKISSFGYRPHWSPDGSQILFYSVDFHNTPSPPKLYLVGLDGAPPREVLSEALSGMTGRLRVSWHPDGKRVSLWSDNSGELAFETVALVGGGRAKSEINPEVVQQIKSAGVDLFDFRWGPSGRVLYFEGISREVRNLWKVEVDPQSLRWIAGPERLTTAAGPDTDIAISPDGHNLAFTTRTQETRLWSFKFNALTGQVKDAGQPITPTGMETLSFDLSRDGKRLAFIGTRAGRHELRESTLADGKEKLLTAADAFSFSAARWSRDGKRLAYVRSRALNQASRQYEHTLEHSMMVLDLSNGNEQVLTSHHQLQGWSWDWTADEQYILGSSSRQTPGQWGLYLFPLGAAPNAENQVRLVSSRPGFGAFNARFSPDEKWICFIGGKSDDAGDVAIYVVPAVGGEWIRITEGREFNDKPRWSPDGRTIYFISNRTGFFNLWARSFDPVNGQPVGEVRRLTNFDSPGRMIPPRIVPLEMSLVQDRLVVPIMEVSGGIWILENVDR